MGRGVAVDDTQAWLLVVFVGVLALAALVGMFRGTR